MSHNIIFLYGNSNIRYILGEMVAILDYQMANRVNLI